MGHFIKLAYMQFCIHELVTLSSGQVVLLEIALLIKVPCTDNLTGLLK